MDNKDIELVKNVVIETTRALTPLATKAYEASLYVVKINCIQELIKGGVFLLLCVISIKLFTWKSKKGEDISIFIGVIFISLYLPFIIYYIFNIWNWIGIYNPELYLANEIITKVIKR